MQVTVQTLIYNGGHPLQSVDYRRNRLKPSAGTKTTGDKLS